MGKKINDFNNLFNYKSLKLYSVKEPVFPFKKFQNVDVLRGPEMRSTGEVMGIDKNFYMAFLKSQIAAGINLPSKGTVFLSVKDKDKKELIPIAQKLVKLNFDLLGTEGTCNFLQKNDIPIQKINKISQGSPHVVDLLESKKISLVINTTEGKASTGDSYIMRRITLLTNTPYYITIKGADAAIKSIEISKKSKLEVRNLQSIY